MDVRKDAMKSRLARWALLCGLASGTVLAGSSPLLFSVGQTPIRQSDLEYRIRIERVYRREAPAPQAAAVMLINDALEREVARRARALPTSEEVAKLVEFVDRTTKAPEKLQEVKAVFGADKASYRRLFIEPGLVNRKLRKHQSLSPSLHSAERRRIEEVFAKVRSGGEIEDVARAANVDFERVWIETKPAELPDALRPYVGGSIENPVVPLLGQLRQGETYPGIVEDEHGYRVVRMLEKTDSRFHIEAATVQKQPFESWFSAEVRNVRITSHDPVLVAAIKSSYPDYYATRLQPR
jgi:hypothetical protein